MKAALAAAAGGKNRALLPAKVRALLPAKVRALVGLRVELRADWNAHAPGDAKRV